MEIGWGWGCNWLPHLFKNFFIKRCGFSGVVVFGLIFIKRCGFRGWGFN